MGAEPKARPPPRGASQERGAWGWGGWSEGGKEWQLVASGAPCLGVGWRPGRRAEQEAGSLQRVPRKALIPEPQTS